MSKKKITMKKLHEYESPNLEIIEFFVEQGFAGSLLFDEENAGEGNGPDENEEWGDWEW